MSLQVEKLEHNMAKLTIEVSAEELEGAIQKSYLKQRGNVNVPGFRKRKAPCQVMEKMFGVEVFYEDAANTLIPDAYAKAYDEADIDIVSQPSIEVTQIEKGRPFIFTAEVAVRPEVKLGEYKGVEVDKFSNRVTAKEIDAKLEEERNKNARTVNVEGRPVQKDDEVILDFEGFVDGVAFDGGKGENYSLTIGSNTFIPGFEDQLIGVEAGKEVEVNVTFPEDYHEESLKGKPAVFKCTVHEIKAKELPELDDEFASEVSEFDTLEELKADIKAKIKEQKNAEGKSAQQEQALDTIIAATEMDIPDAMVETEARQMVDSFGQRIQQQGLTMQQYMQFTGMDTENMLEEMRPQAMKRIQTRLVLEAIVAAENIVTSDERLDEEIAKMAEMYSMEADQLKSYMGDTEKEQMKKDIAVEDAVQFILDNAVEK